jgi:hypothetical protein
MSLKQLRDAYEGLGAVLKELTSNTTQWRNAQYASMFYAELGKQIASLEVNRSMEKYQQIQQAGGEARLVCRIAKMDGADDQMQRKILNKLYRLSSEEIEALIIEEG